MVKTYTEQDKRPFNMAFIFLERLNDRLNEGDLARQDGDLLKWYRVLKTIYNMVYFKLEQEKEEEKEKILKRLDEEFSTIQNFLKSSHLKNNDVKVFSLTQTEMRLDKLANYLYTLLYKYELLYPHSQQRLTIPEALADDY